MMGHQTLSSLLLGAPAVEREYGASENSVGEFAVIPSKKERMMPWVKYVVVNENYL